MEATFQDKKQRHTGSATLVGIGHKHIYKRVHTRFVVAEVGSPLEAFPSSKVMFGAIHDAFQAHKQAYEECGIIHRDVSGGNILILDNNLLNDWDLAKKEAEDQDATLVPDRTGTWQFMSFGLLQDPYKRHTARGDLESFFWVVLYYGLHYLSHSFTKNVPAIMADIFDKFAFTHPDGVARGGTTKAALVRCPPLIDFVFRAVSLLKKWQYRYDLTTHDPTSDDEDEDEGEYVPVTHSDMEFIWIQALQSPL
ncbi:hypothetical protein PLEOSDRAFT_1098553 [Pleurotus ostreatus PC15]|uniref:Fungal-type protein kinase domain-containing protein n=1 Tax=Pleurotus ostreatus (strain PC15) TaxID=1137138 RepID=A0A067P7Y8_PLEO1|nr:hypothetical protein PLEOSDRAFT_1098553 [Pleurotus ostreatus PC15]